MPKVAIASATNTLAPALLPEVAGAAADPYDAGLLLPSRTRWVVPQVICKSANAGWEPSPLAMRANRYMTTVRLASSYIL